MFGSKFYWPNRYEVAVRNGTPYIYSDVDGRGREEAVGMFVTEGRFSRILRALRLNVVRAAKMGELAYLSKLPWVPQVHLSLNP